MDSLKWAHKMGRESWSAILQDCYRSALGDTARDEFTEAVYHHFDYELIRLSPDDSRLVYYPAVYDVSSASVTFVSYIRDKITSLQETYESYIDRAKTSDVEPVLIAWLNCTSLRSVAKARNIPLRWDILYDSLGVDVIVC